MHNLKFFDFEVYPHWWCCVVSDELPEYPGGLHNNKFTYKDELFIKSTMRVYRSDRGSAIEVRDRMKAELKKGVLTGYNNKRYDMIIAKCVALGFSPENLYKVSQILLDDGKTGLANKPEYTRVAPYAKFGYQEGEAWQDLLDDSDKSLKDKECSLGMDIRETTVPFGKEDLTEEEKDEIIFYCKHDVYALHVVYICIAKGYIDTKIDLCNTFGLDKKTGYINTNANLCGKVLGAQRAHGTTIKDPTITIRDPQLKAYFEKWVPEDILNHLLTSQRSRKAILYGNLISIADGGLHSEYYFEDIAKALGAPPLYGLIPNTPELQKIFGREAEIVDGKKRAAATGKYTANKPGLYIESTEEWTMYNVDASSCYASVMMYCDSMSRAITNPKRLHQIYLRRIKLKQTPKSQWTADDKAFVAAAKLILNTTYGAMGNKWLALYDDYMRSKTCRVGQMILIAIGNCLFSSIPGLKVIQNNTDGILVYARRSDLPKIQALVDEFSAISHFIFEVEEDSRLWQLNVNNYVAVHDDTKPIEGENLKNKGGAFVMTVFQPGYNKVRPLGNFCISRAQIAFYTKKENPIKHLLENTSVTDFCLTCTKGPGYSGMIQSNKDCDVALGKVGRVIAVTDKCFGQIYKTKSDGNDVIKHDTVALCPPHPLCVNDALYNYSIKDGHLHHVDGRSWEIDYAYYARELDKALDVVWYKLKNESLKKTKEFNL